MNPHLLRAIRFLFPIINNLAPKLAVHIAARLFTTPFRKRPPNDLEQEKLDQATHFSLPYQDTTLSAYRWGDPHAPIVLFVHGWTGTAASFVMFIEPLLSKGFQVVAYDALAHGASPGKTVNLMQWTESVTAAVQHLKQVHCIIGHSLGGGAIKIASSIGLNTQKIVLIAPLNDIIPVTEEFAAQLSVPKQTMTGMLDYFATKYRFSLDKYGSNWRDVFDSAFNVPTLILHDEKDKEIPWENGDAIARQWPWASFVTTRGLGHRRILISDDTIKQVTEFVTA